MRAVRALAHAAATDVVVGPTGIPPASIPSNLRTAVDPGEAAPSVTQPRVSAGGRRKGGLGLPSVPRVADAPSRADAAEEPDDNAANDIAGHGVAQ